MDEAEVLGEIAMEHPPRGVAWDGEALWVALEAPRRAFRLDPATGKQRGGLALPEEGRIAGLAWTARGELPALWLVVGDRAEVVELDPGGGGERRRMKPSEDGWDLRGLCTDGAAGPTLWFLEGSGDDAGKGATARAGRVDVRDGEVHKRIVLEPDAAGLDWDGRRLWAGRRQARRLVRVDAMFADVDHQISLPFSPLDLAWDGAALWVADADAPRLVRIACPPPG